MPVVRHPAYRERYQRNKPGLGKQRGAKVAQIDLARKLTEAIWHMLTKNQPFDPAAAGGATFRLAPDGSFGIAQPASDVAWSSARRR